jgi:CubicO group peptidase (beta-lactamase class C family)
MQSSKWLMAIGIFFWSLLVTIQCGLAQQMVFPGANWESATPESVLVDPAKLASAIAYIERANSSPGVDEMVIIRNGRLIWEGSQSKRAHHTYSVTKSFASTTLGLVIDDGLVTLDTLVKDYVPATGNLYPEMTLRHAATHTSGYLSLDETYPFIEPFPEDPFSPGIFLFQPPGSSFAYNNTPFELMMNVLTRVAGETMQDLFERRIAGPIGMDSNNWDWGHYTTDDGLSIDGGGGYLDRGIVVSATDLARLGQLYMNDGNWNDQQLISNGWVNEATKVQVPTSTPKHPQSPTGGPGVYGYGWWVGEDAFEASGHENNRLKIWTDADLIVARLGTSTKGINWNGIWTRIYRALDTEAVWDDQGDGFWEDIDPETGKSRWRGPNETELVIYPDNHPGSVFIRANHVTAKEDHRVDNLTIDGGVLRLADATLSVDKQLLLVDGIIQLGGLSELTASQRVEMSNEMKLHLTLVEDRIGSYLNTDTWILGGGTLELSLTPEMNPVQLIGETFDLFDWTSLSGEFDQVVLPPLTTWDLSGLYTTGEVVLTSIVPEPSSVVLLLAAFACSLRWQKLN